MKSALLYLLAGFGFSVSLWADPLGEIAAFSSVKIDAAKLEKGEVISARTAGVSNPRGQSIESVFVVAAPLEKTVESFKSWNGSKHSDLKVYLHGDLPGSPAAGDFKGLAGAPSNGATKALAAATEKGEVQLGAGEGEGAVRKDWAGFWSSVLAKRAQTFVGSGLPGQPAYASGGQKVLASEEANALLKSVPKIAAQFRGALAAAGVTGKPSKPELYYELVGAEGGGVLNLGSSAGKGTQEVDVQYYSSGSYYVFVTLQQAWPTTAGGKPATLVYRCDLTSAAELGKLRGIERNAAGAAMAKEMSKVIGYFQKDTAR